MFLTGYLEATGGSRLGADSQSTSSTSSRTALTAFRTCFVRLEIGRRDFRCPTGEAMARPIPAGLTPVTPVPGIDLWRESGLQPETFSDGGQDRLGCTKELRGRLSVRYDSGIGDCYDNNGVSRLATIRFAWSPALVALRREACPRARWEKSARRWIMSDRDAQAFLRAAHARFEFSLSSTRIEIDNVVWIAGFAQGAPCPEAVVMGDPRNGGRVQ
jgi:hypothetical protein